MPDRTIGIFFGIFSGDFLGFIGIFGIFWGIFRVFWDFLGFFLLVDGTVEVKERLVAVVKTAVIGRSLERC